MLHIHHRICREYVRGHLLKCQIDVIDCLSHALLHEELFEIVQCLPFQQVTYSRGSIRPIGIIEAFPGTIQVVTPATPLLWRSVLEYLKKGSDLNACSVRWIASQLQFDFVKCRGGVTISLTIRLALRASIVPLSTEPVGRAESPLVSRPRRFQTTTSLSDVFVEKFFDAAVTQRF